MKTDIKKLAELAKKANEAGQGTYEMVYFRLDANPAAILDIAAQMAEKDKRIAELEEYLKLAGHDMDTVRYRNGLLENKITQLEAELVGRDQAAGEPVAWRYAYLPSVGDESGWKYVESEDLCNASSGYIAQPLSAALPLQPSHEMIVAAHKELEEYDNIQLDDDAIVFTWQAMLQAMKVRS